MGASSLSCPSDGRLLVLLLFVDGRANIITDSKSSPDPMRVGTGSWLQLPSTYGSQSGARAGTRSATISGSRIDRFWPLNDPPVDERNRWRCASDPGIAAASASQLHALVQDRQLRRLPYNQMSLGDSFRRSSCQRMADPLAQEPATDHGYPQSRLRIANGMSHCRCRDFLCVKLT